MKSEQHRQLLIKLAKCHLETLKALNEAAGAIDKVAKEFEANGGGSAVRSALGQLLTANEDMSTTLGQVISLLDFSESKEPE